jgi:hypothetical protein
VPEALSHVHACGSRLARVEAAGTSPGQPFDGEAATGIRRLVSGSGPKAPVITERSPSVHQATTSSDRRAAGPLQFDSVSDYEWQVELAAKGLRERDNHPMPNSVTTPEAFYGIMARAALEAIGLPALLNRVSQAEQELDNIQEALKRAEAKAENARHRR